MLLLLLLLLLLLQFGLQVWKFHERCSASVQCQTLIGDTSSLRTDPAEGVNHNDEMS